MGRHRLRTQIFVYHVSPTRKKSELLAKLQPAGIHSSLFSQAVPQYRLQAAQGVPGEGQGADLLNAALVVPTVAIVIRIPFGAKLPLQVSVADIGINFLISN